MAVDKCASKITSGIVKDCKTINAPIGVDKDLILVNYDEYDRLKTLADANQITAEDAENEDGLTAIFLKKLATQYVFEGTDYSVIPNVTAEVRELGDAWYLHSIVFTVYNKTAKARKVIESLGNSRVIAICVDRSTGLYELFGSDQGLKITAVERAYTGAQNSNFYTVTIATPDIAVVRESTVGMLALSVVTDTE